MEITYVLPLPPEDSGLQNCIARLHSRNIDSNRKDRAKFFRREPIVVLNRATGAKVLRYVMGNGNPKTLSLSKSGIALDYDAVDTLGIRFKAEADLEVRRATILEIYGWFWRHPDLSIQLAIRLALVGVALGAMGFVAGVTPLILG